MEVLIKAGAVVLISSCVSLVIRSKNPELSFVITIICSAIICIVSLSIISEMKDFFSELIDGAEVGTRVILPVIKCVGIALTAKLISQLCLDAGQNGAKTAVEYLGTALALYTTLPLLRSMLLMLEGLL